MACEDARLGVGDDKLHADGERRSDSCLLYLFLRGRLLPLPSSYASGGYMFW